MSDTPRTDAATLEYYDEFYNHTGFYLVPSFGKRLERECDQLAKQCVKNVEEIGQLRAELREAKKDAARLAFLLERNEAEFRFRGTLYGITREEIDAAMEARKQ